MIWIIGGTTETGQVLDKIRGDVDYLVTVATSAGKDMLSDERVRVVRMDSVAMLRFLQSNSIDMVVDLSHPYAIEVSQNSRLACQQADVRYIRFVRDSTHIPDALYVSSLDDCFTFLKDVRGCVFLTTGSKNIPDFQRVRGNNRFIYRVLPTPESLEICARNHVAIRDIVAMAGPLSEALNMVMFQDYQAEYVVMKDSGKAGGTAEKVNACRQLRITPVIIGRPIDDGVSDLEVVWNEILCHTLTGS